MVRVSGDAGQLTGMKTAIILIVRNEVQDIVWWLAHHLGVGISTLIIYDAGSTDGTWSLLQAARRTSDIRPHRLDDAAHETWGGLRRRAVADVRERYGREFDWLGVFGIEDYLTLAEEHTLQSLFPKEEDYRSVLFSHRLYGGNGYIGLPRCSPVHAYIRHAPDEFPHHGEGILFVRSVVMDHASIEQSDWGLDGKDTLRPSGQTLEDHEEREWTHGWVRRYAVRSMAHQVRRLAFDRALDRQQPDLHALDRNDVEGTGSPLFAKTESLAVAIYGDVWADIIRRKKFEQILQMPDRDSEAFSPSSGARFFRIQGLNGEFLCCDQRGGHLVGLHEGYIEKSGHHVLMLGCVWEEFPGWIVLFREDGQICSNTISHAGLAPVPVPVAAFETVNVENGAVVAIRLPATGRFLTLIAGTGEVCVNRVEALGWEHFHLVPVEAPLSGHGPELTEALGCVPVLLDGKLRAENLAAVLERMDVSQSFLLPLMFSMLPEREQVRFNVDYSGLFPSWLSTLVF
ncbi:glycosyltransferase [Gluconobacter sphaericus NBRC 12467]|nr:glycosyltransferase [Gluconobacter sphaericus NBRC 12467]